MAASQCWPSDLDTKNYNQSKKEGWVGGDVELRAADTNQRKAQGPECDATLSFEIIPAARV